MSGRRLWTAFGSGLLFGSGLVISGMADPNKVLGFLDVFGAWNPSLLFVMGGAIAVHAPAYALIKRRSRPLFASEFAIPDKRQIDLGLVGGAALFGIGWGIGGYCPGPVLVALPAARPSVCVFVAAMLLGMWITSWGTSRLTAGSTAQAQR